MTVWPVPWWWVSTKRRVGPSTRAYQASLASTSGTVRPRWLIPASLGTIVRRWACAMLLVTLHLSSRRLVGRRFRVLSRAADLIQLYGRTGITTLGERPIRVPKP